MIILHTQSEFICAIGYKQLIIEITSVKDEHRSIEVSLNGSSYIRMPMNDVNGHRTRDAERPHGFSHNHHNELKKRLSFVS